MIGDGNGDDGVLSALTPAQRRILFHLLTAELTRFRAAASAAGATEADLNASTARRYRAVEAMVEPNPGPTL